MQINKILPVNKTSTPLVVTCSLGDKDTILIEISDINSSQAIPPRGMGQFILDIPPVVEQSTSIQEELTEQSAQTEPTA